VPSLACAAVPDRVDIKTWHSQIDQHASAGVNKILIGNKCDWDEKRVVSVEQGRDLADEFGLRFLETSAKANEGVEEAFFTLARSVFYFFELSCADIQSEISRPA
jgi:GTPase SAR1 family protein